MGKAASQEGAPLDAYKGAVAAPQAAAAPEAVSALEAVAMPMPVAVACA